MRSMLYGKSKGASSGEYRFFDKYKNNCKTVKNSIKSKTTLCTLIATLVVNVHTKEKLDTSFVLFTFF